MNATVKIIQIGNSLGVTLPKEVLAALKVEKGDCLILTEAPGREFMREYRDTLRALAK